jgi:hypothetical protein
MIRAKEIDSQDSVCSELVRIELSTHSTVLTPFHVRLGQRISISLVEQLVVIMFMRYTLAQEIEETVEDML